VASPAPSAPPLPCSERHGVRGSLRGYGVRDGLPDTGGKIGARRRHPARLVSISSLSLSLSLSRARGSNGPAPGARASRGEQGRARAAPCSLSARLGSSLAGPPSSAPPSQEPPRQPCRTPAPALLRPRPPPLLSSALRRRAASVHPLPGSLRRRCYSSSGEAAATAGSWQRRLPAARCLPAALSRTTNAFLGDLLLTLFLSPSPSQPHR
jgi:hypothetical protein